MFFWLLLGRFKWLLVVASGGWIRLGSVVWLVRTCFGCNISCSSCFMLYEVDLVIQSCFLVVPPT